MNKEKYDTNQQLKNKYTITLQISTGLMRKTNNLNSSNSAIIDLATFTTKRRYNYAIVLLPRYSSKQEKISKELRPAVLYPVEK